METNFTPTEDKRVIELPINDPAFEDTELMASANELFHDSYEYFPDFGI